MDQINDHTPPPEQTCHESPAIHSDSDNISISSEDAARRSPRDEASGRYWTAIWLRRPTLLALMSLFTALAVALIVLRAVDKARDGIRPTLSSNHYAWTYGPTAILVFVLSLWRQVDYYCKLMQPWQEMHKGPKDAQNSLLLDYVFPLMINSFTRAVRRQHVPVAASIAGFSIMKLIILFSTGLLVLTPTTVSKPHNISLTTAFTSDQFWNTVPNNRDYVVLASNNQIRTYPNISAEPVNAYLKTLEQRDSNYNDSSNNIVFQSLDLRQVTGLHSVVAEVDAFAPNISCEIAQPSLRKTRSDDWVAQLDSATCSVGAEHQTPLELKGAYTFRNPECPPSVVQYNFWRANCSEIDNSSFSTTINADTPYDFRFALLVSNFTFETVLVDENFTRDIGVPHETTAVICKIDYSMNRANITQDLNNDLAQVDRLAPVGHLNNLTGIMLGEIMYTALYASDNLPLDGYDLKHYPEATMPLYYVLLRTLVGDQSMNRFLTAEILQSSASQVWAGIGAQFIRRNYMRTTDINSTATGSFVESRLHVGMISLWMMVAGFVLLIMLTICIILTACQDIVPRNPGPLATSGLVMTASPSMNKLLGVAGDLRTSQLSQMLSGFYFETSTEKFFQIKATKQTERGPKPEITNKANSWIPLTAQYPMVILTLIVPVAAITALEVLYENSERNHGLLDVYGKEKTATYLSRYISSAIVLLIATLFNSLDFIISSFAPYSLLRSGAVPASCSLCFNVLGRLAPVALSDSLKARHFGSVLSNSAGIIGSVLAIVSSGLWVIDRAVIEEYSATASLADVWNISWPNSSVSGDGGAGVLFNQVQHGSVAMPSTIWQDLVLPSITSIRFAPGIDARGDSATQNHTFALECLRPNLSCEVISDEHLNVHFHEEEVDFLEVNAFPPLPPGCQRGGKAGKDAYYNFTSSHASGSSEELKWMGNFYDLHLGPWRKPPTNDYGEDFENIAYQSDNPAGCPSIGVIFARSHGNKTHYDDVSALLCSQKMELVSLNVTYNADDTMRPVMNADIAPVVIPNSVKYLTNGTERIDSLPYRVQTYLQGNTGNLTRFNINDGDAGVLQPLDEFMNHLVYGLNGTALDDLTGKPNRERFTKAVGTLYTRYMTLVIDQRFRQPVTPTARSGSSNDELPVTGTTYRTTSRLRVNYASKLALQVMLATMTIMGAFAFWLADLRRTLPRKPTTIANTLALFAGSDLCEEKRPLLPERALWMRDKELDRIFDGWLFSLGWWSKTHRSGSSIIGSVEDDEPSREGSLAAKEAVQRRFGIDVGNAEQLGFR